MRTTRHSLFALLAGVLTALLAPGLPADAAPQVPGLGRGFTDVAPEPAVSTDVVTATAAAVPDTVRPGGDVVVKLVLDIRKPWHIWPAAQQPREGEFATFDDAIPLSVNVGSVSPSLTVHSGFTQWPEIHGVTADIGDGPLKYAVLEGRSVVLIPVTVAADAAPGDASFTFELGFQACDDDGCLQPSSGVKVPVSLRIAGAGEPVEAAPPDADVAGFDPTTWGRIHSGERPPEIVPFDIFGYEFSLNVSGWGGYLLLLLVAALGGLLLNFTPCVLPVIPLKIMGLSSAAGNRSRCFALGLTMSIGVVAFWLGLGTLIASVTWFKSTNQLFQLPAFTIGVGVVIAIMAIGMAGFFSVSLPQWVYSINPSHDSYTGSFGFGVMTAVLSTPCTAPLMGAAAAWAATQSAGLTLTVFAAIGIGMALPYMVLSAFPHLVEHMPRSGPASELIKQVMGLLLLAAAVYFIGAGLVGLLATPPEPPSKAYWWVVAAFGAAAGGWMLWRTIRITSRPVMLAIFGGLAVFMIAMSVFIGVSQTRHGPIAWVYYTPERFADAIGDGNVVVMDFTAEWCLNCKALESAVLYPEPVSALLNSRSGVVPIKVDITGNNELGNEMLRSVGRVTIPLLVVFAPDGTEVFKSDAYTAQQVIDAIEKAKSMRPAQRTASRSNARD